MPFSISQKHKNKINRFRKTAPFLAMSSKRVKKTPDSIFKFIRKTKPTVTVSRPFWRDSCFSQTQMLEFYSFIHDVKKLFAVFYLFDKNTCFSLIRSHGRGFFRPEASLFYFFIQKFFPRFFPKNPHVLAIENIDLVSHFKNRLINFTDN